MYKQLILWQRYIIFALLSKKCSKKEIAEVLGCHVSTVYREIKRNSSEYTGEYRPHRADRMANIRKHRYQNPRKLTPDLVKCIICLLKRDWSAEQISGWLKKNGKVSVSHETIYKLIHRDKDLRGTLYQHCRFKLKHRKHRIKNKGKCANNGKKSITERPIEANGKRFGDWEMDLIVGPKRSAILTIIERNTNRIILRKLPQGYNAKVVAKTIIQALRPYKKNVLTITTDNGTEFVHFKQIEEQLQCQIYYAKPYAPWQKGAVENANMLIRQYIPKGFNINSISHQYIAKVEERINKRPRKKLNFRSPKFVFNKKNN